jgi:hypothetical protein
MNALMTHLYFIPALFVLLAIGMALISNKGARR